MRVEIDLRLNGLLELFLERAWVYILRLPELIGEVGRLVLQNITWAYIVLSQVRYLMLAQIVLVIRRLQPLPVSVVAPFVLRMPSGLLDFLRVAFRRMICQLVHPAARD